MKDKKVLLCDRDREYIEAVTDYFCKKTLDLGLMFSIRTISEKGELSAIKGEYDTAIIGEDFYQELETVKEKISFKKLYFLSEERIDKENYIFKYSNANEIGRLFFEFDSGVSNNRLSSEGLKIYGIYSPIKHELSVPFSVCFSMIMEKQGRVLFLDLSELGILSVLLNRDFSNDIVDAVYLLENNEKVNLADYFIDFEGISILSQPKLPAQLSYITYEQWKKLFLEIEKYHFEVLVIFFGSLVQGFTEMIKDMEELILLKKQGDFYSISDSLFREYIDSLETVKKRKEIFLPMSAVNLTKGGYRFESLIKGKLMDFVEGKVEEFG